MSTAPTFAPLLWDQGANWKPERGTLLMWQRIRITTIRLWPKPAAWEKDDGDPQWKAARYVDLEALWRPPRPEGSRSEHARYAAWCTIPERERNAIRKSPFNLGYHKDHLWQMLVMLGRCPGGTELAEDVPLLAAALCRYGQFRQRYVKRHLRSFRALLRAPNGMRRWRKVATWLGFDPSRAFIDLLRRARNDVNWKVGDLCTLREAWANPRIRTHLQHARTVHPATARLFLLIDAHRAFDRIGPELRAEICQLGDSGGFESYFQQIAAAYRALWPDRVLPMLRCVDDLELERERVRIEVRNHFIRILPAPPTHRAIPAEMPAPPFPGTERLEPLTSPAALVAEGAEMHHCIGRAYWAEDARRADGFGYRYRHGDERATLWIRRTLHGRPFEVLQFRGPQNAAPSAEATLHVQHWLESWLTAVEQQQVALAEPWNELPCPLLSDGDRYGVPRALQWAMRDDLELPDLNVVGRPYRRPRRARRRGRAAPVDIDNDAFWAADPPARRPVPGMALWLDYEAHVEIPF